MTTPREQDYFIVANEPGKALLPAPHFEYQAYVDRNPFGFKRERDSAYTWKYQDGELDVVIEPYGAEVGFMNADQQAGQEEILEYLKQGLEQHFFKRKMRIIPVQSHHVYILSDNPDESYHLPLEDYINKNPCGFSNQNFQSAWVWIGPHDAIMRVSPELPGLEVVFSNTSTPLEEDMIKFLGSKSYSQV